MTRDRPNDVLRHIWQSQPSSLEPGASDYVLLADVGGAYAARSREGIFALVIELGDVPPQAVGRRASGCELVPYTNLRFGMLGREWTSPAAALLCTNSDVFDAFCVLAADIHSRLAQPTPSWKAVLEAIEQWQSLMSPRGGPTAEFETGLWGELWLLASAASPDVLLPAWRGPDGDATDFFLDGKAAEVKTSRQRRQHHISVAQVDAPVGENDAWLLSIWVGVDPVRGETVPALVRRILARSTSPATALRRILMAGYSPADFASYEKKFVVLAEPEWYAAHVVPRVRVADSGVSRLRYVASLDEDNRAPVLQATGLWQHFLGNGYGATQ